MFDTFVPERLTHEIEQNILVCTLARYNMKQVLLVRDDLSMSRGKAIAQDSHASVNAVQQTDEDVISEWLDEGGKKIVLRVSSSEKLLSIIDSVEDLPTSTVRDLGYTEVREGTLTAGSIGPAEEGRIDRHTGNLPLFR